MSDDAGSSRRAATIFLLLGSGALIACAFGYMVLIASTDVGVAYLVALVLTALGAGVPLLVAERKAPRHSQRLAYFLLLVPLAYMLGVLTYGFFALVTYSESDVSGVRQWFVEIPGAAVCALALMAFLFPFSFVPRFGSTLAWMLAAVGAATTVAAIFATWHDDLRDLIFAGSSRAEGQFDLLAFFVWQLCIAAFLAIILGHADEEQEWSDL